MDNNKNSVYFGWTIPRLKKELIQRGATLSGRKEDLIARLEAYDRNQDFKGEPIILPEPLDTDWPQDGYHQLQSEHRILLPKLSKPQIDGYFQYREAVDKQSSADLKSLEKGKLLYESDKIHACSVNICGSSIFLTGIVGAAMKKKVTYSFKLKLIKENAEIQNSHCECPSGKGPHGTCKHVAAVLFMLHDFVSGNNPKVQRSCTEILQTFHTPKRHHTGTPLKAENITAKKKCTLEDPRPVEYRGKAGYKDHVRNVVINYCSHSSSNLSVRYLYDKADVQDIGLHHDYLQKPLLQQWVDNSQFVTDEQAKNIEMKTRTQANSIIWRTQRQWRITASRFGEICNMTVKRNLQKLCRSFICTSALHTRAIIHGKQYESTAIKKFSEQTGIKVNTCGLFICKTHPYLAATPDGIIDKDILIEVKCPYAGRDGNIQPGKLFPYLKYDNEGKMKLKEGSNYHYQIQGQMYISERKYCYFVVYTFKDLFIYKVEKDTDLCEGSMLPKLELFYTKHLRPFIADHL